MSVCKTDALGRLANGAVLVRAASFELAKDPGFKPSASSSSATPASWCPLIDLNDHDRSRRCLKPLRLPIPPRGHWCARRDLNPHGVTRRILSAGRLPIPPRAHGALWWLLSTHLRHTNPVLSRMSSERAGELEAAEGIESSRSSLQTECSTLSYAGELVLAPGLEPGASRVRN